MSDRPSPDEAWAAGMAKENAADAERDAELTRLRADNERLREALTTINNLCNTPHWNADRRRRIERLSDIASTQGST